MFLAFFGDDAALGGAGEKTELQEVGLVEILDGGGLVAGQGGDGGEADGAVAVVFVHELKHIAVGGVEAEVVDFHEAEGFFGDFDVDDAVAVDVGVVADAL